MANLRKSEETSDKINNEKNRTKTDATKRKGTDHGKTSLRRIEDGCNSLDSFNKPACNRRKDTKYKFNNIYSRLPPFTRDHIYRHRNHKPP